MNVDETFWTPEMVKDHQRFLKGIAIAVPIGVLMWIGFFWFLFKVF